MAKKKEEETPAFELDLHEEEAQVVVPVAPVVEEKKETVSVEKPSHAPIVNCLRNEKVIVRHIPRQHGNITNPKHVLYGKMSNNAIRKFSVPRYSNGTYVNVLTNAEKTCLEQELGLEYNALSVHRKVDNFWSDATGDGISQVTLTKQDNIFDLSKPVDYIKYKVLLANKEFIAPSMQALQETPKATYQFVIINEGDETKSAKQKLNNIQRSYKEFGKIENDRDVLRFIVETISGHATAPNQSFEWLQTEVNKLIQADAKMFLSIIDDEYMTYKILVKKAVEMGALRTKANQYYFEDGRPLCEYGEEATLGNAAKYLGNIKHQGDLFALQAKVK